jgi:hypothetical protein
MPQSGIGARGSSSPRVEQRIALAVIEAVDERQPLVEERWASRAVVAIRC